MAGEDNFLNLGNKQDKILYNDLKDKLEKKDVESNSALSKLFNIFDTDKSGVLDSSEIQNIWNNISAAAKKDGNSIFDNSEAQEFLDNNINNSDIFTDIKVSTAELFSFIKTALIKPKEEAVAYEQFITRPDLTLDEAKNLSIDYIQENLEAALETIASIDNGWVSQGYDGLKNFFDTELSSKNVNDVIMKERDCIGYLREASNNSLTKREYYEGNKTRLKEMFLRRLKNQDQTGLDLIDKYKGKLTREKFEEIFDKYITEKIDSIPTMEGIKALQHELIMLDEATEEDYLNKFIQDALNFANSVSNEGKVFEIKQQHPFDIDEPLSFEDVYLLERGVEFSESAMEALLESKNNFNCASSAYQKLQGLKENVKQIISDYNKANGGY